ncbi:N,N'-diacetyllegionaminate synthase [soil metagenome]
MKNIYIIAEAGVNHNGSIDIAKKLIDKAKDAGADAVKFQTFKAESLVSKNASKADYQKTNTSVSESQLQMLKKLELTENEHRELLKYSNYRNIEFLSSPFDEESAAFLISLGLKILKIPSGEITNIPFLKFLADQNVKIILSTGMSDLSEVSLAVSSLNKGKDLTLLHCVTEYPAPFNEINLKAMETLKKEFEIPVGYSDHTSGIEIALAAAALGAEVIEKHFTLDKNMEGPDHKASLNTEELKNMIIGIRNIEAALGNGRKIPAVIEMKNINIARKSLVVNHEMKKGTKLLKEDLCIKRPGTGIKPVNFTKVIGMTLIRDIDSDEVLNWEDLI